MSANDSEQMIDDCEDRESSMSEWEGSFIDSVRSQIQNGRALSEKQNETLEKIWDRVTAKG